MNEQTSSSRKIIVSIGMAVVIGSGAVMFAMHSHRSTPVAQLPIVPAALPQDPDAAATVPQTPDAASSLAQADSLGSTGGDTSLHASNDTTPPAIEAKSAGDRHVAKVHTRVGASNRSLTGTAPAVDSSETLAAATVVSSPDGGNSVGVPTVPSASPSGMAADAPEAAMSAGPAVSSV
jgi:hypothetical protein